MQKLSWYMNRLRCMSAAEVVYRVRTRALAFRETRWPPTEPARSCGAPGASDAPGQVSLLPMEVLREAGLRKDLEKTLPDLVSRADRLCDHRFTFLGMEDVGLGDRINWHLDPVRQVEAPRVPAHKLDYRDVKIVGENKNTWEINRHQHLPALALACVLTGEERYAREAYGQLEDWIRDAFEAVPMLEATLTHEIALETCRFDLPHRDPADRFLVATSRVLDLALVTADRRLIDSKAATILGTN